MLRTYLNECITGYEEGIRLIDANNWKDAVHVFGGVCRTLQCLISAGKDERTLSEILPCLMRQLELLQRFHETRGDPSSATRPGPADRFDPDVVGNDLRPTAPFADDDGLSQIITNTILTKRPSLTWGERSLFRIARALLFSRRRRSVMSRRPTTNGPVAAAS